MFARGHGSSNPGLVKSGPSGARCGGNRPGAVCVSHPQVRTWLAQSTVSAYMAELERAELVKATRVGKWTHYKRDEQRIAEIVALLGQRL
jgi:DNA-binding transcriptional ArsR family regulator